MLHGFLLKVIYGLAMGDRSMSGFNERFNYSLGQRISARIVSKVGRRISIETIRRWHHAFTRAYDNRETQYVLCTNNAPTCLGEKHSHRKSVYDKALQIPFWKGHMPIPLGYDVILTSGYSNNMQLPPEEKRVPDHLLVDQAIVNGYYCER